MTVRVVTAAESAAWDADAIRAGVPSRALMRVASAHAAAVLVQRCGDRVMRGVTIYTGPGNNGGDGWCVARALVHAGIPVSVVESVASSSPDAVAERALTLPYVSSDERGDIVVDALLGTGASGAPRGAIAESARAIDARRATGAYVVALDGPTGLDATTGEAHDGIEADLTIAFGTCKRGHLISRARCGEIVVVDIGLAPDVGAEAPVLVDAAWVTARVPAIPSDAHKGTRKKLAIVGGAPGMGGAPMLAAEAALRSGIGMVRIVTEAEHASAIHERIPAALTSLPATHDADVETLAQWADTLLIGPGLGASSQTRAYVMRLLTGWRGPVVLDADALNVFAGDIPTLAALLDGRPSVLTPHPAELGRLVGASVDEVLRKRFEIGSHVAGETGAAVLLKGTPTVVSAPDGARAVSAAGSAVLATGGSGDVLGGIVATLLAQGTFPADAAACAAWVHGRAAERCGAARGATLEDVLAQLAAAWPMGVSGDATPHGFASCGYPVLAELPKGA